MVNILTFIERWKLPMKMEVSVLEEKEYGNKIILFPIVVEIETNDICVFSAILKTISVGNGLMRLTNKSFKALKKELIRTKMYERLMVK